MAPPRMGKAPVSASSSEEEEMKMETAKKRRMDFKVMVRHLLKGKYVNLKSFTPITFTFPELLRYQGLHEFITDNGKIYTDLVKSFLNHFTLNLNDDDQHMLSATMRDCEIVTDLRSLAASLRIPYSGFFLRKGVIMLMENGLNMIKWNITTQSVDFQGMLLCRDSALLAYSVMLRTCLLMIECYIMVFAMSCCQRIQTFHKSMIWRCRFYLL